MMVLVVVRYAYDAWGKVLSITGSMADTLGVQNPLRYRGYVYDQETGQLMIKFRDKWYGVNRKNDLMK